MLKMNRLRIFATNELKRRKMACDDDSVSCVVSSMLFEGAGPSTANPRLQELAVSAAASLAKFGGSSLFNLLASKTEEKKKASELPGLYCPKCHQPMVLAVTKTRPVSYCEHCRIALPMEEK